MSDQLEIAAIPRDDLGKGASRRLRRRGELIPAIIYGAGKDPQPLSIISKDIEKALETEAFYTQVIAVKIGNETQKAILKDLQRHPAKHRVMHADFLRIDEKVELKVSIPIHFVGEEDCHGVKFEGGIIEHQSTEIEVQCLPGNIPEYIEVDMTAVTLGDTVHLSDVPLPEGVVSVALSYGEDHDEAIASVVAPRSVKEQEADESVDIEAGAGEQSAAGGDDTAAEAGDDED
jgi:large subunit ribosomal protein L25